MRIKRPHWTTALLATALLATAGIGHTQPTTIKVVVPFPAGGVTDQAARVVSDKVATLLGQTVVVDNRPGAGGRIGVDAVVKATPDGTTWLFTNTSYSILPVTDPKAGYDPLRSLLPVNLVATYGLQIVTGQTVPVNSLGEFIAHARKQPGRLSYGSAGMGSGSHFAGEYFKSLTQTHLVHIPYKSTTGALTDVAGGQLELAFDASAAPLINAGRVKLLAVTSAQRDTRFPNTPTAQEAGLRDFVLQSWVGYLAPVGTAPAVSDRFSKAVAEALKDPAVAKRLADMGLQLQGQGPAGFADAIAGDVQLYRRIAVGANLRFDQ
ncbi:MAG: hypothetical protein RJA09_2415 [Pseudomonadota bacterium]|jgi:tripartite-type tricarboxylate transporter receptor subunit TctC